jgi:hypothetical protein
MAQRPYSVPPGRIHASRRPAGELRGRTGRPASSCAPWVTAFFCLACGGRAELAQSNARPQVRTAFLFDLQSGFSVVDFTSLEHPKRHNIDLTSFTLSPMDVSGQRLIGGRTRGEIEELVLFSAPNWAPHVLAQSPLETAFMTQTRFVTDGVLVANADNFQLMDAEGAMLLEGSSTGDVIEQDSRGDHALVPGLGGSTWIRPGPESIFIPDQGYKWSFKFAEPKSELVAIAWANEPIESLPSAELWTLRMNAREPGCDAPSLRSCAWQPTYIFHHEASNRAVIGAEMIDEKGNWKLSISVLPWGAQARTDEKSTELAFARIEMDHPEKVEWTVRGDLLWVWAFEDGGVQAIWQLNIRTANAATELDPAVDLNENLRSHQIIGDLDLWLQGEDRPGATPEWWYFSLLKEAPKWHRLSRTETAMAPLGDRGAIFLGRSAPSDPLNPGFECQPCTYWAIQDLADDSSLTLSESVFHVATNQFFLVQSPVYPTPDGSGVLVIHDGQIDYRTFARPDKNFRLTQEQTTAALLLPERWETARP